MIAQDCSDVANGAFLFAAILAGIGFAFGWWIKKALMLEEWREEQITPPELRELLERSLPPSPQTGTSQEGK